MGGGGGGGGAGGHYGPSGSTATMEIGNDVVGLIIGKAGETIKRLQSMTGANIQVQRDTDVAPGSRTRMVTLTGAPHQVQAAQMEITQLTTVRPATPLIFHNRYSVLTCAAAA